MGSAGYHGFIGSYHGFTGGSTTGLGVYHGFEGSLPRVQPTLPRVYGSYHGLTVGSTTGSGVYHGFKGLLPRVLARLTGIKTGSVQSFRALGLQDFRVGAQGSPVDGWLRSIRCRGSPGWCRASVPLV